MPISSLIAVAIGMPPISSPPSRSVSAGSSCAISRATRASSTGSASKRYLSKYSLLTWPLRSVNSPVRRQVASMSAASSGSVVVTR